MSEWEGWEVDAEKSSGNSGRKFIVSGNERRKVFHLPYNTDEWADIVSDSRDD